jgi:hypothetical protein
VDFDGPVVKEEEEDFDELEVEEELVEPALRSLCFCCTRSRKSWSTCPGIRY